MRLTESGTFVHGNYWSPAAVFGAANTSHGCIGLPTRAAAPRGPRPAGYFGHSLVGDVVRVVGSRRRTVDPATASAAGTCPWAAWLTGRTGADAGGRPRAAVIDAHGRPGRTRG